MSKLSKQNLLAAIKTILQSAWTDQAYYVSRSSGICGKVYCHVSNHSIRLELISNPARWGVDLSDSLGSRISQAISQLVDEGCLDSSTVRGWHRWKNTECDSCSSINFYSQRQRLNVWRNDHINYVNPMKSDSKPMAHSDSFVMGSLPILCKCCTSKGDGTPKPKVKKEPVIFVYNEDAVIFQLNDLETSGVELVGLIPCLSKPKKKKTK